MKEILKFKNLLFFSIVILLSSCGKTIDVDDEREYITESNNIMNYKGIPFTGKLVEYHDREKTKLLKKETYQDGKLGLFEDYYVNGQLSVKGTYKDGQRDGLWESYSENGKLEEKTTYKDGVKQDN